MIFFLRLLLLLLLLKNENPIQVTALGWLVNGHSITWSPRYSSEHNDSLQFRQLASSQGKPTRALSSSIFNLETLETPTRRLGGGEEEGWIDRSAMAMVESESRSLVELCLEAASESRESVERWRRQVRTLERLPSHLADSLLRRLVRRRLLYPSLLEYLSLSLSPPVLCFVYFCNYRVPVCYPSGCWETSGNGF